MNHNTLITPAPKNDLIESVPTQEELVRLNSGQDESWAQIPHPELVEEPSGAEFRIDDINYAYLGRTESGQMSFSSTSSDGIQRPFLVYRSRSEGSLRASQGLEIYSDDDKEKTRLMKGPELSDRAQYTQDTQLHPDFDEAVSRIEEARGLRDMPTQPTPLYDTAGAEWFMRDFERAVESYPLGSQELDELLIELKTGEQSIAGIEKVTGLVYKSDPEAAQAAYLHKIDRLNEVLEASGVMPDFSQAPASVQSENHPILGNITKETFNKSFNGLNYQWQMARDKDGRIWVDRIRFADAEPTAYGTDKQLVFSGILTSKPMDYKKQVDGLPTSMTLDMGNGYVDISKFLQALAPIREYAKHHNHREEDRVIRIAA